MDISRIEMKLHLNCTASSDTSMRASHCYGITMSCHLQRGRRALLWEVSKGSLGCGMADKMWSAFDVMGKLHTLWSMTRFIGEWFHLLDLALLLYVSLHPRSMKCREPWETCEGQKKTTNSWWPSPDDPPILITWQSLTPNPHFCISFCLSSLYHSIFTHIHSFTSFLPQVWRSIINWCNWLQSLQHSWCWTCSLRHPSLPDQASASIFDHPPQSYLITECWSSTPSWGKKIHSAGSPVSIWVTWPFIPIDGSCNSQPGYKVVWSLQLDLCHISLPQWTFQQYLFTCVSYPEQLCNFSWPHHCSLQFHFLLSQGSCHSIQNCPCWLFFSHFA